MNTNIHVLEKKLGYSFQNKNFLKQALTHRSHGAPHNERLEFLGDSLLNFSMASILYERLPHLPEGDLSRIRAYFVKQEALAKIAHDLDLGDFLLMGEGEYKSGGWKRPSILSDAVEAILAAVYLDCGSVRTVYDMVFRLFESWLEETDFDCVGKDAKSLLQELLQKHIQTLPQYVLEEVTGPDHCQEFRVSCHIPSLNIRTQAKGSNRKQAERSAAAVAYTQAFKLLNKKK